MVIGRIKIEPYGWMVIILFLALCTCMSHGWLWGKGTTTANTPCIPCALLKSSSSNEVQTPAASKSEKESSSKPPVVSSPTVKSSQSEVVKSKPSTSAISDPSKTRSVSSIGSPSVITGQGLSLDAVHFRHNSSRLDLDGRKLLDLFATNLQKNGSVEITIDGNADSTGKPERNLRLSQRRAETVKKYLAAKLPASAILHAESHGDTRPAGDNKSYDGRELNRRVELRVKLTTSSIK